MLKIALLVAALALCSSARCPDVTAVTGFNVTKYLGVWYELARSPLVSDTFERSCYCTRATYGANHSYPAGQVSVDNVCRKGSVSGKLNEILGYATSDKGYPSKLTVYFPGRAPVPAPYWVVYLQGDYEAAVVWSCVSVVVPLEYMWILSRTPTVPPATYSALVAKAQAITGYDATHKLQVTQQTGCTYHD